MHTTPRTAAAAVLAVIVTAGACTGPDGGSGEQRSAPSSTPKPPAERPSPIELPGDNPALGDVIPAPETVDDDSDENFAIGSDTVLVADDNGLGPAEYLADVLRPATGYELPVESSPDDGDPATAIVLATDADAEVGGQGYELDVSRERVTITARETAGLFNGVHTVRQLLPTDVESGEETDREWVVAGGSITDRPRFGYRGAMLDVARHFFDVDTVKRHIDRIAQYKINYLHLHLTDDQGWRIQIDGWPKLTEEGAATQVGGGEGGFYTKEQFTEIVRHASARGVNVVPEIDMPGHTNAALHSYPELTCDGERPPPYTDTQVGFSTLCIDSEETYSFVRDVIEQVAELTDGPYLHIGGDEADETSDEDYAAFFSRVLPMVVDAGKRPLGWHEYASTDLPDDAVVQYWRVETEHGATQRAAESGHQVIMSPASKAYVDMKYAESDAQGNTWAGPLSVQEAYDWDPAEFLDGVGEDAVLGVEAPLFTELVESEDDIERMAFPRTQAIAEVGWSSERDWSDFRSRLADNGDRMAAQDIGFHPAPDVGF